MAALGLCCCAWAFLQLRPAGATLHSGARASHCGGFSCCRARALGTRASVVVAHRLQSAGSVVVAHGLSCSVACGIFLDQGSNPCPLHWQADSQPLHHQGSPHLPSWHCNVAFVVNHTIMYMFISGVSVLFHWSAFLPLYPNQDVLNAKALS